MNKLILALFLSAPIHAQSFEVKEIVSVYDGDTFRANLNCDVDILCNNISIRVRSIDTPEIRGKCEQEKQLAIRAKDKAREFLHDAKSLRLVNITKGKYFRLVANVVNEDMITLSDFLLSYDLAVPYDGDTKSFNWCIDTLNYGDK